MSKYNSRGSMRPGLALGAGYCRVPDEIIMTAKKKPAACSDRRWRIELARRRNEAFYDLADSPAIL